MISKKIGLGFAILFFMAAFGAAILFSRSTPEQIALIAIVFLAIMGAIATIGIVLLKEIVFPLQKINKFIQNEIKEKDYSGRIELKGDDEIVKLAEGFNIISGELNKEIEEAKEMEMEIALNLPDFALALRDLAARNEVRPVLDTSKNKLIAALGEEINKVIVTITLIIQETDNASMELALGLSEIFEVLKKVSEGNLLITANEGGSNEMLSKLGKSTNETISRLRETVSLVRNDADKLASSSQEFSSSIQELNSSTQEISGAITQVSKGAVTQAERAEETFEIMEKSAVSLKQVVSNAQIASQAVDQASNHAESGREAANEAVQRIERLTETVLEAAKVIQGLGQMSQQIGEITETITSIADQTNLLSLNAAIEAARAGEAGRGFAVVADEVRKLAEGSAEAVRKIGSLIRSIQSETSRAVNAIQESSNEVVEGKTRVVRIAGILAEINKTSGEATVLVQQIAEAARARMEEVERVVKAVNEVATIAKESASTTEEVTSSTEEQTASMEQMTSSAQELATLATELRTLVSKFKLKE